jgi:hypothetical protein
MRTLFALTIIALLSLVVSPCWAGIPFLMNYQGMLTDTLGNPLNGDHNLTFKIYSQSSGGSALWTETHTSTQVQDGLFNVILGSLSLLPSSVFEDTVRYLGITVGSDAELSPRIRITSIPYAYRALVADSAAVAGSVVGSAGGWVDDGSVVRLEANTDKVGIGTSSPGKKLTVAGGDFGVYPSLAEPSIVTDGYNVKLGDPDGVGNQVYLEIDDPGNKIVLRNANVGIGTTTPDDDLHVADHIRVGEDPNYSTVYGELKHDGGGDGFKINAHAGGGTWADIHFQTNASTKMFIESAGNVGIGTTSPSEKLDVEGNIDVSDNEVKNYFGFPQPDYNTGWVSISQGETKTFTHGLGGSYYDYVVDLMFYDNTGGVTGPHQEGFGGWFDGSNYRGTYWYDLDASQIKVHRWSNDTSTDWVRVRIWVIR